MIGENPLPKVDDDLSVKHLSWLVPARSSNEETALLLYATLDKHRDKLSAQHAHDLRVTAGLLAGASFALWRAVFLSDNQLTSDQMQGEYHLGNMTNFMANIIANNTIGYVQDRKNRNFTFVFYLQDARYRLRNLSEYEPVSHLVSLESIEADVEGKEQWTHFHALLTEAIRQFDIFLDGL